MTSYNNKWEGITPYCELFPKIGNFILKSYSEIINRIFNRSSSYDI